MGVCGQLHAPNALPPGKDSRGTHSVWGWMGPRAGLDAMGKRKILCPCRESNTGRQAPNLVAMPTEIPRFHMCSVMYEICPRFPGDRLAPFLSLCIGDLRCSVLTERVCVMTCALDNSKLVPFSKHHAMECPTCTYLWHTVSNFVAQVFIDVGPILLHHLHM
jgi:hypothetical protein